MESPELECFVDVAAMAASVVTQTASACRLHGSRTDKTHQWIGSIDSRTSLHSFIVSPTNQGRTEQRSVLDSDHSHTHTHTHTHRWATYVAIVAIVWHASNALFSHHHDRQLWFITACLSVCLSVSLSVYVCLTSAGTLPHVCTQTSSATRKFLHSSTSKLNRFPQSIETSIPSDARTLC